MDDTKLAKHIFDKWKVTLAKKPPSERGYDHVQNNFEELFYELSNHKISLDAAHSFMDVAVAAHMPPHYVIEKIWPDMKKKIPTLDKKTWLEGWRKNIEENATAAFYAWYSIDEDEEEKHVKQTGQMSPMEYSKQRKLADSFISVTPEDLAALKAQREAVSSVNLEDLEVDLGVFNGKT